MGFFGKGEFAKFGLRHEIAKRYPPMDWFRSLKVAKLIDSDHSDQIVSNFLLTHDAGLIGRLGGTEARFIGHYLKLQRLKKFGIPPTLSSRFSVTWRKRRQAIHALSGFYADTWDEVNEFVSIYLTALKQTDVLGAWGVAFTWIESIQLDGTKTQVIPVGHTSPWIEPFNELENFGDEAKPWAGYLSGKKVLVISSFADSIKHQHPIAEKLFSGKNYPNFDVQVIRAPQTSGERDPNGSSWFELLNGMKKQMNEIDFDIALVAAGAYSYPLALHAKEIGKIGIHTGGGLQIFFGIMGNRWNESPEVLKYLNEFWTRPTASETPLKANDIEGACYW
jgi:hypothetical protein